VDNIEHEHVCYYSVKAFNLLCESHGMKVVKIECNDVNGGAQGFIFAMANIRLRSFTLKKGISEHNAVGMDKFIFGLEERRKKLRASVQEIHSKRQRIGLCGASTRGLTLLHYLVCNSYDFCCVGDRDPRSMAAFMALRESRL